MTHSELTPHRLDPNTHSPRMCRRCMARAIEEASGTADRKMGFWWCASHQTLGLAKLYRGRVIGWTLHGPMPHEQAADVMASALGGLEKQATSPSSH